jgi:hypothetical protein
MVKLDGTCVFAATSWLGAFGSPRNIEMFSYSFRLQNLQRTVGFAESGSFSSINYLIQEDLVNIQQIPWKIVTIGGTAAGIMVG